MRCATIVDIFVVDSLIRLHIFINWARARAIAHTHEPATERPTDWMNEWVIERTSVRARALAAHLPLFGDVIRAVFRYESWKQNRWIDTRSSIDINNIYISIFIPIHCWCDRVALCCAVLCVCAQYFIIVRRIDRYIRIHKEITINFRFISFDRFTARAHATLRRASNINIRQIKSIILCTIHWPWHRAFSSRLSKHTHTHIRIHRHNHRAEQSQSNRQIQTRWWCNSRKSFSHFSCTKAALFIVAAHANAWLTLCTYTTMHKFSHFKFVYLQI